MIARDSRIRLGDLDEWLAGDGTFAEAALHILKQEKPLDTFTAATAGKALIQHWLEERQLKCYAHGREIDYFTEVGKDGVFPDENGDYGLGLMAVEHDRIIDRDELLALIVAWKMPLPINLTIAAPPIAEQAQEESAADDELASLFNPVSRAALEKMFPDSGWANYAERAARNGLSVARENHGRGMFNPYRAAVWWLNKQKPSGWDLARVHRTLANNLPARSFDSRQLLTGEIE